MPEIRTPAYSGTQDDILTEARDNFARAYEVDQQNRDDAINDLEFAAGEQWPDAIRQERENEGRPVITINRMPQFINRVTGNIRNNRPSIRVRPWDDVSDPEVADIYTGLIRAIESQSDADAVYQCGANSAAACGIGHFRVLNDYAYPESFSQDLIISPIENPFAVWWDPMAKDPTRKDAMWCLVTEDITHEDYEADYPGVQLSDFEGSIEDSRIHMWRTAKTVRIAEYWWKKKTKKIIGETQDGKTLDITDVDPAMAEVMMGVFRSKEIEAYDVWYCKLSGTQVLEDPKKWPGRYIPIVAIVGNEIHIGERTVRHGVIRFAKDPQRLYNYSRSTHAEVVSLQPKAPFVATPDQVAGHEDQWENANRRNFSYLLYNADPLTGGRAPERATPPVSSQGLLDEITIASEDMKGTTGIYDAALGAKSNEKSGVAIAERQEEADVGTSVYPDNLARSVKQLGRILVELIPIFYDQPRVIRILNEDDTERVETINELFAKVNPKTGQPEHKLYDMSLGKYDVTVSVGPTYATRRAEAAETMLAFVQSAPQTAQFVMDLIAKNMDWPGADEMAERLRKTLPPGLVEEEDDDGPNVQEQMQAMMQELMQVAQQIDQKLDTDKRQAEVEKMQEETDGIRIENVRKALEAEAMAGGQSIEDLMRRLEVVEKAQNMEIAAKQAQQPQPAH